MKRFLVGFVIGFLVVSLLGLSPLSLAVGSPGNGTIPGEGMIIQFHTPGGIVEVNTKTVTDYQLSKLSVTREALDELIPRDLEAEIDELKVKIEKLEKLEVSK